MPNGALGGLAPGLTVTLDNIYTTTTGIDGSFTFNNVESGAYLLTISGESSIARSLIIATTSTTTNLGNISVACFDYIKDDVINEQDLSAWSQWISTTSHSVSNVFADINGDGTVNGKDYACLMRFRNKTKKNIYSYAN